MDCRDITFSADKSRDRIDHALRVFPRKLLMRVLAFALHLLGAGRKDVAALVDMPEESVKTRACRPEPCAGICSIWA
jgi:hypothetical protein